LTLDVKGLHLLEHLGASTLKRYFDRRFLLHVGDCGELEMGFDVEVHGVGRWKLMEVSQQTNLMI
jgi:hypothetical protein